MSKQILVYCWADHANIGDELFKDAFWHLFPQHRFTFTDTIASSHTGFDAIFIGGGSFLEFPINGIDEHVFKSNTPIFYIGVDGSVIHPHHQALMKRAKLISLRSSHNLDFIKSFNPNTTVDYDLVYSLYDPAFVQPKTPSSNKKVLLLPNINCVPRYDDAAYKHIHWQTFKFEFAQFLDALIADGYCIQYMPMSTDKKNLDDYAMIEIKNLMHKGHLVSDIYRRYSSSIKDLAQLFSQYGTVISQRFHGNVLAEMSHTPYLAIAHHDKLRSTAFSIGEFASYYACSKTSLLESFRIAQVKTISKLPINRHLFEHLQAEVAKHLE
jgi:hypothetical protein